MLIPDLKTRSCAHCRKESIAATWYELFGEILVPTEEVVEMRDGKKRKSDRKFFPDTCWYKWK